MKITKNETIKELGFNTLGEFSKDERKRITNAIEHINFENFESYFQQGAFEDALSKELGGDYSNQPLNCKIFERSKHTLDLYNCNLRIAVEIEKTKTTTLLLDVMKFIIGHKNGKIDYGVLIFPDKYRTKYVPKGAPDRFYNRLTNELEFIRPIVEIKDILVVEYDTSCFFK